MSALGPMMNTLGPLPGGPAGDGPGAPGGFPPSIQIGGPDAGAAGPDDPGAGAPGAPDNPDAEQDLHTALDALHKFMQDEDDHIDKAIVAKCVSAIQGLLGTRQKGAESALGVTPAHKAMSRSY